MHIVTAAHDFYPDPGSGGTGRYIYETSQRLAERGHLVSVVTRRRGNVPDREVVEGVSVYRYDLDIADQSASAILSQLPRANSVVADHVSDLAGEIPPDVLSVQGPVTSLLVDQQIDNRVPRVPTFHSPWPVEYRIRTRNVRMRVRRWINAEIRWRLERNLLSKADGAITLSEFMREELERVYGFDNNTTVIPGGVDAEQYTPGAGPSGRLSEGKPTFLTVRRLSERMGHQILLDAFATVTQHYPKAHLYVAGDGPLREQLEHVASTLGIDDETTFLGYVPDQELSGVYASADIFVLPTTELEGFGLATLEALASGMPVVATPVGGTVEVLSGLADHPAISETMLVSTVSAEALADRMLAWADLPNETLEAAGRACRRYVIDHYSWERTVALLEAYYEQMVG